MALDYLDISNTASELLTEFGSDCTIRKYNNSYNPSTNLMTESFIDYVVKGVKLALKKRLEGVIDGKKYRFLIEAGVTIPRIGDLVIFSSIEYKIIEVTELSPSGVDVIYQVIAGV